VVGDSAPNFVFKPLVGSAEPMSLKALRGKVVLLDFWGTFCPPCKESFPRLESLSATLSARGLYVIGVNEDDTTDGVLKFARTYGAKFAIAWDEDKSIARQYQPQTMPCSFVIDKRGVVRYAHLGYRAGDEVALRKEVQELLAQ
jgi:peroxiredoxin